MGQYNQKFNRHWYKVVEVNETPTLTFAIANSRSNRPLRILYAEVEPDHRKNLHLGTFVAERLAHMTASLSNSAAIPVVDIYTVPSARDLMDLFRDPEGYLEHLIEQEIEQEHPSANADARRQSALRRFFGYNETEEVFLRRINSPDEAAFDLVFLDIRMTTADEGKKDYSGLHALRDILEARKDHKPIKLARGGTTTLRSRLYGFPVVFLTGYSNYGADLSVQKVEGLPPVSEADGFVIKPLHAGSIKSALLDFLDGRLMHPELRKNFLTDDYREKKSALGK